jgi:NADH-quinone oxidoreductase subunit M
VSHLGFVVLGIAAMNTNGVQGAVYQMVNHGISTGGLFIIVGMLSDRRHTRLIAEFGGLKSVMPRLVAAFLIITLSSIGLPGLNGFVGEFLILLGAFAWSPGLAAVAATGVILSAVYMLWMFQRVNYGPVTSEKNAALADLGPREWAILVPIVALTVLMGVAPNLFLRPIEPAVQRIVDRVREAAPSRILAESPRPVPPAIPAVRLAPSTGADKAVSAAVVGREPGERITGATAQGCRRC